MTDFSPVRKQAEAMHAHARAMQADAQRMMEAIRDVEEAEAAAVKATADLAAKDDERSTHAQKRAAQAVVDAMAAYDATMAEIAEQGAARAAEFERALNESLAAHPVVEDAAEEPKPKKKKAR